MSETTVRVLHCIIALRDRDRPRLCDHSFVHRNAHLDCKGDAEYREARTLIKVHFAINLRLRSRRPLKLILPSHSYSRFETSTHHEFTRSQFLAHSVQFVIEFET